MSLAGTHNSSPPDRNPPSPPGTEIRVPSASSPEYVLPNKQVPHLRVAAVGELGPAD